MKILIYVGATRDYHYATEAQIRCVCRSLNLAKHRITHATFVVVGDEFDGTKMFRVEGIECDFRTIPLKVEIGSEPYEAEFQLVIAQMRQAAFDLAVRMDVDLVWGLDADVLPKPNALRCMMDAVEFDGGTFYDVAFCPYPSQGGGPFMGGRGTPQNHICPDFYEEEMEVDPKLIKSREALLKKMEAAKNDPSKLVSMRKRLKEIGQKIKGSKPKGNIFAMNAEKWRKRGWCDNAYPALGRGTIVPFDWCGSGCTLMTRRAYTLCDFTGYGGEGTEDLFIIWKRWYPAGIKIAGILHCPSDHVIRSREKGSKGKLIHLLTGHESDGEYEGHLRQTRRPWYSQSEGEKFDILNDGNTKTPPPTSDAERAPKTKGS